MSVATKTAHGQRGRADGPAQHRDRQAERLDPHAGEFAGAAAVVRGCGRRSRHRQPRQGTRRGQPDEDAGASLALARDQPLSVQDRRDRAQRRGEAAGDHRPPGHPAHQSRIGRTAADHQHHPLRYRHLQSRRHRARACAQPEREPHDPVGQGRLHECRGRALRMPPRRHRVHAERHLARPRQRRQGSDDLDRHAGLAADGISRLRVGRSELHRREPGEREIAADDVHRRTLDAALRPRRV